MSLYKTYMDLWARGFVNAGFSPRIPDYAIRFWLEQLECALPKTSSPQSFLDIGAGDGRLSQLLLHTYSPHGMALEVQVDPESWQPMHREFPAFEIKTGLLQNTMSELIGKRTFTFILLAEVFEHIPPSDVQPFLEQLKPLLAKNGRIFLTTPNRIGQGPAETSPQWHERQPWGHWKHYTLQELTDLFQNAGFKITRHVFECHRTKIILYNAWFYPTSRLDGRLLTSKKIPSWLKDAYFYTSIPVIFLIKLLFWGLAQAVHALETNGSSEENSDTIMITLEHTDEQPQTPQ